VDGGVEGIWQDFKLCLLEGADEVCGKTKGHGVHKETWWWNDEVGRVVEEKRTRYRELKKAKAAGDNLTIEEAAKVYNQVKRNCKRIVWRAKEDERKKMGEMLDKEDGKGKLFRAVKQMVGKNKEVVGGGCLKDCDGNIVVDEERIKQIWKSHFEKVSNEEFDWNKDSLSDEFVSGPIEEITCKEIREAMKKMKSGKAAGPSGVYSEMLTATGELGIQWMTNLCNTIVREGKIPVDWGKSWLVSIYKGKGDAMECGSYRGVKLLEHALKVFERVIESRVRRKVDIDAMQFGFRAGKGTTDAIFIVRQLQERYIAKNKDLWMAFVDLEKAFDRVPRQVLWWALREVGVEEWLVRVIQSMYEGVTTAVRVDDGESESFEVKVGVHQGSVLSPLLFIIVLEALSRKFRSGLPFELFYADDLVLMAETESKLMAQIRVWKENMEAKGLRVNLGKTKVMKCYNGGAEVVASGKYPCSVCKKGVGNNSIECSVCKKWVHYACTGFKKEKKKLKEDLNYKCSACLGQVQGRNGSEVKEIELGQGEKLEVVQKFCYLGDMIGSGGGAEEASRARVRCAWGKFNQLTPMLTGRGASWNVKGKIYKSCVQSVMIYGSETWPMKVEDARRLERTERAMMRRMCGVKLEQKVRSVVLYACLNVEEVLDVVRRGRLRWFGHVERMDEGNWVSACRDINVKGVVNRGRGKKTWMECVKGDLGRWGLKPEWAQDRDLWRAKIHGSVPTCAVHGNTELNR